MVEMKMEIGINLLLLPLIRFPKQQSKFIASRPKEQRSQKWQQLKKNWPLPRLVSLRLNAKWWSLTPPARWPLSNSLRRNECARRARKSLTRPPKERL